MAWTQWRSPDSQSAEGTVYIMVPVYSEQRNEDGSYDIIGQRREYVE